MRIGKDLVVNGTKIVAQAAWNEELEHKHQQIVEWLQRESPGRGADPAQ